MIPQEKWQEIVNESAYTITAITKEFDINPSSLTNWVYCKVEPRQKSREKMEEILKNIAGQKRIPRHPSYGYATEEQIKKLERIGLGPDRDFLLKQIQKQNETCGKTVF